MPGSLSQGIFISYRRADATPYARLLKSELAGRFPDARVFMDLDSIEPGLDFGEVIRQAVDSCAVLVILIGRQWLALADSEGHRRLDDPDDFVRFEIQTALERGVRVIPVLVDDAMPPRRHELPAELQKLARLNALELSSVRYQYDADRLLNLINKVLVAANELTETAGRGRDEESRKSALGQKGRARDPLSGADEPVKIARRRQAEKRVLYIEARAETRVGRFEDAIGLLDDLLILDPDYPGAAELRDTAQRGLHLASTYAAAIAAEGTDDWITAVRGYDEILQIDQAYRDVPDRKAACESRQQVADLQAELRHHAEAGLWQAVLDVDAELVRLDPASSDPDRLATRARSNLDAEEKERLAQQEAERKAQRDAELQMRAEKAIRRGKAQMERKAREAWQAQRDAALKAQEEADRKAQEDAERQLRAEKAQRRGVAKMLRKARQQVD